MVTGLLPGSDAGGEDAEVASDGALAERAEADHDVGIAVRQQQLVESRRAFGVAQSCTQLADDGHRDHPAPILGDVIEPMPREQVELAASLLYLTGLA
jgi:hypothetical protein